MKHAIASSRRIGASVLSALCLAVLWGCTGTFETRPPTLLVVAFEDGSGPAVALVRDTFNVLQPGETRELVYIAGSRRALPAGAVDNDVVDRTGIRPTAVFLSRDPQTDATYLRGFTIEGIGQSDPTGFDPAQRFSHVLANGGVNGDEGLLERGLEDDYCPTQVQVSETGRYLAVFEQRSACGGTEFRAIYVIDLDEATDPGVDPVVERFVSPEPAAAGMFLDQDGGLDRDGRETLYFVDPSAGVRAWDLASESSRILDIVGLPSDAGRLRDIGRVRDRLVLVDANRLFLVEPADVAPEALEVASATDLMQLVTDPFAVTPQAVLRSGAGLVIHADAEEPGFERETGVLTRTDAVLEPIDRFVYLSGDGRIDVFDLLEFGTGLVRSARFDVPEIPSATTLTWTRAIPEALP